MRSQIGRVVLDWQPSAGPGTSLKAILDWVLITKALRRKSPVRSWEAVAEILGCPLGTLSRIMSRRTGMSPAELSAVGRTEVLDRIERLPSYILMPSARDLLPPSRS